MSTCSLKAFSFKVFLKVRVIFGQSQTMKFFSSCQFQWSYIIATVVLTPGITVTVIIEIQRYLFDYMDFLILRKSTKIEAIYQVMIISSRIRRRLDDYVGKFVHYRSYLVFVHVSVPEHLGVRLVHMLLGMMTNYSRSNVAIQTDKK